VSPAASGRVLLVVPPFHQLFAPAIGVSLLKAALTQAGLGCDVVYLNIRLAQELGPLQYTRLATEGRFEALGGDWVFAGELFGELAPEPRRYVEEVLLGRYADSYDRDFAGRLCELRAVVPAFLDRVMDELPWERYALVGVSSTHAQNCAALALLRRIKLRHPAIRTALGGANCEGPMGAALHEQFPFVDYVCSGEADRVFPELVQRVLTGQPVAGLPGLHARGELSLLGDDTHTPLVRNLDQLPYPDYDDYFVQFAAAGLAAVETPMLSLETARGCWWGQKHHCTFCGLNGEGMAFRAKSPRRALDEIDYLLARYPSRRFYATDNILDLSYFESLLPALAERPRPPRLFYMTKANLTKGQLRLLARAGAWGITPGLESLSNAVLRLMDKGNSGLQNVRTLKWCAEIGLVVVWAWLYGFPGEEPTEYRRLAELVPALTHLPAPAGLFQIRLDRFSPNFNQAAEHGLVNLRAAVAYQYVYPFEPAALDRLAYYFDYDYADGRDPASYSGPLKASIATWRQAGAAARLELRLTDERVEIEDSRPAAARPLTVLEGPAGLAYLALDSGATARAVQAALRPTLGPATPTLEQLGGWLEAWLADRLVMREGDRYLSLATNPAERVELPVQRFLASLAGSGV
jgi:ribosomal peptide maturation radical SAM protein 1